MKRLILLLLCLCACVVALFSGSLAIAIFFGWLVSVILMQAFLQSASSGGRQ